MRTIPSSGEIRTDLSFFHSEDGTGIEDSCWSYGTCDVRSIRRDSSRQWESRQDDPSTSLLLRSPRQLLIARPL